MLQFGSASASAIVTRRSAAHLKSQSAGPRQPDPGLPPAPSPLSVRQRFRIRFGPGLFLGMTFGDWLSFLRANHFNIDRPYLLRAAAISVNSLTNSTFKQFEDLALVPKAERVKVEAPVFILGHARSGTTYLHNLLAMDQRFAYPNIFQVYYPHTFLSAESVFAKFIAAFLPKKRPQDDVAMRISGPAEDEVANCIATGCSPYMRYVVPQRGAYYDRYFTFHGVPREEIETWRLSLTLFLQKLTWKYGRPLLLKSPPHTCRIRLLLEMFPDARFIHIHRNPYQVFQSTKHLDAMAYRAFTLQRTEHAIDGDILRNYNQMYDAYFAERQLVPAGQFHELSFEDLETDPIDQVRTIYEALELPSFDEFQPRLQEYLATLASYRKNRFPDLPTRLRQTIHSAWHRSFEEWDYAA